VKVRRLFLAFVFLPAVASAIGLQDEPVGSKVDGPFQLGNKRIPVAAGDWTLIASHTWTGSRDHVLQGTNFAGVYLVEIKDARVTRAVQAWGNVDPSLTRRWRQEVNPCKPGEKVLAHRDFSQNDENQFCFDVQEIRGYMKKSTGWRVKAQQWLAENKVAVPPNALFVRFAKLERAFWTEIYYYFDPAFFAGASDAERVQSAAHWAEENLDAVRKGLATPGP
jgi:hypothetical protein